MLRALMVVALACVSMGTAQAQAQEPKAKCNLFHKSDDGRWVSKIDSKVGNPKDFKLLKAGLPIDPGLTVAGINVAATVESLCGGK